MADNIVKHDYNGNQIKQRVSDDFVCLTDMAKVEGRLIADYLRLESTKAYVEALSETMGIPIESLVVVKGGRNGSTFAHPEIAMDCAQWVSIPFRIWANRTLVQVVKDKSTPPPLPPADIRVVNLLGSLTALGMDISNPRFNQELQDLVMDKIIGGNRQIQGDVERWAGVAEIAEDMGYAVALVTKHRSQLGRWVAMSELQSRKEKRLCNGTQREINLYLDCPELREAIVEFMDAKVLSNAA
jgi:KilA-N domain